MAISLIYTPPFIAVERAKGNSNGRIVCQRLVWLAIKLLVAQFRWTNGIMKAQSVCGQKRDAFFAPPPASYEPAVA